MAARARAPRQARGVTTSLRSAFVSLALVTSLPFALLLTYLAWGEVARERDRAQQGALARATLLGAQIEKHLAARIEGVAGAAAAIAGSGAASGPAEMHVRRLKQSFPDAEHVVVVNELGVALASIPPAGEGRTVAVGDQAWFRRAATSTEPFVSAPRQVGPEIVVGIHAPVRTPEGQLRGVLGLDLSLRQVQQALAQSSLEPGATAEVLTEQGVILARHPALFLLRSAREATGYGDLTRAPGTGGEVTGVDGEHRLAAAAAIRPVGWMLVAGVPSGQVLSAARRQLMVVTGAGLVVTVLAVLAAVAVSRRHAQGVARLRGAMGRLEAGDLPATLPVTVGGEIGALTESFNRTLGWLRGKLREYEVVSQVEEAASQAIGGSQSLDGLLPGLLRRVVSGMSADAGVLLLEEEGVLVARAAVGFPGVAVEGTRLRRGQGLAGAAASERAATAVPDVEADYRIEEPYVREGGLRSIVAMPMATGDGVVGVVEVGYRAPHAFSEAELQQLEAIVRRTTQAVERARALDAVQRSTQGLEAQLAEKLEALEQATTEQAEARRQVQEARRKAQELERQIKQQAARIPQVKEVIVEREVVRPDPAAEQAARLRAELSRTVSEELRVALTALMELPRFLVEGLQKPLGEAERGQLEILQERGQEILELIEGLGILTGIQSGRVAITRAPVDVGALIQRVVRQLQPRVAARGNRIEADVKPGLGAVPTDARRLEQVLTNLVLSAVKYTEVGEIRIGGQPRDGGAVITVTDDGSGFSSEERARLFQPFLQLAPRQGRSRPGTGLLLTVCERLVTALGGSVRVESEIDQGTQITVTLPGPA